MAERVGFSAHQINRGQFFLFFYEFQLGIIVLPSKLADSTRGILPE
jgi:hypothetical protein